MNRWVDTGGGAAAARSRGRRRIAVWAMLMFLLSLLVQYASFVGTVAAVHDEGIFELDGNALDQGGVPGDDWEDGTAGAADTLFIPGSVEKDGVDTSYFKEGGSKDHHDLDDWRWSGTDVAPDKDELLDVFAAVYEAADTLVYFGADKFDDSGDAQIGFWFFQDEVSLDADGTFDGLHTVGDVLVLSDFTNGGEVDLICVYEWNPPGDDIADGVSDETGCDVGDNVTLVAAGAECDVSSPDGAFDVCAVVNDGDETAPWAFENKDGDDFFAKGQFFEGGINLSQLFGGDAPCFSTFLAETRSSQEVEAQLKDFALGALDTCVPPELETDASVSEADFGDEVTDTATLSGSHGPVEGTIKFFICEPDEVTAGGCEGSAGTQVGSAVTIVNDEAESAAYTVGLTEAAVGKYCWRAEYTPSADSEYLATKHTDADRECFEVAPATIDVDKTADAASVNAGEQIGFTVTISNAGDNTALGVSLDDDLPGGAGIDWSIESQSGGFSISGSPQAESLEFGPASLAAGASATVHVVSNTTADSCGQYDNTASVTTTNDGSDSDDATTEVLCAEIDIDKLADDGLDAGSARSDLETFDAPATIGFLITVTNNGAGTATNVVVDDTLPALPSGADWALSPAVAGCALSGTDNRELDCTFASLASGASVEIHVVANAVFADCNDADNSITLPNTAGVTTTNDGSDEDSATVVVNCAEIEVIKDADDASVNAGEQIGFTVTINNNGAGTATGVTLSDALPGGDGIDWSIESQSGGFSIGGSPQTETLDFGPASLAAGASATVHVVSNTTADSCGEYDNLAEVTTTNDGSDEDDATTEVLCAEIDVLKEADDPSVEAGEQIGFTVTITNHGEGLATGLAFTDNLPGGPGVDWTIESSDAGWSITGTAPNQSLVYAPTTLAAGASTTVHVVSDTTADSCGQYDNTATVTTTNDGEDTSDATTFVECPELAIDKSVAESGFDAVGQVLHYTIVVTNVGNVTLLNVVVTDPLVSDLDCEPDLPVPSLAVGASFTCTATYTIVEADFDTLLVTNVACADDGMGDGDVGANPVCDEVETPGQELEEETDAPTQPPTDAMSGGNNGAPGDGAWLLVLALAILLSTVVFLTPARKGSRT